MRMIDADALLESAGIFEATACARGCGKSILHLAKAWLWNEVQKAPTIDAVPVVHGFWKETDESVGWGEEPCAKCSACDELWVLGEWDFDDFKTFMHYCPNCGARMDGGKE